MQKVYLDSNVFIAYIKSEIGQPFRLMFKDVEDFLNNCANKYLVVLSDLALEEIGKKVYYRKEEVLGFFGRFGVEVEQIRIGERDFESASEIRRKGIHGSDALHAALAVNSGCAIFLTFNKKHFGILADIILIKEPADLLF